MIMPESDAPLKELHLASWETRFWAWLIDVILVGILSTILGELFPSLLRIPALEWTGPLPLPGIELFGVGGILLFLYWTILEGYNGQSLGKMVMNIKVTDREGNPIGFGAAAIESFGKAFLLVPDCLIGWLAMSKKKLRLFNRVSHTIVIVVQYTEPKGVRYIVDPVE